MTIQQAIDTITATVPGAPFAETVDVVKVGDTSQPLTGIVVCFLANAQIIQQTAQQGANLIIAHEPLFYNHLDKTDWLEKDAVYDAKRQLLADHNLVVWRFHDYLHSIPPDATVMGLMNELGWQPRGSGDDLVFAEIPPMSLQALAQFLKQKLGLATIRIVGDLNQACQTVAIMPGFPSAQYQIEVLRTADVLIAGEIHEWETNEYTRDANILGHKKALIVIGHAASEEPGMRLMITWLQERLPEIPIQFVPMAHPSTTFRLRPGFSFPITKRGGDGCTVTPLFTTFLLSKKVDIMLAMWYNGKLPIFSAFWVGQNRVPSSLTYRR